ncbi:DNA-binding response regulator [Paenibacillus sp. 79R4]|uniref:response regulator n=1 Tax=Paenibacillus sp. 79R4 TaxID=2212847 RepID=UPI0015BA06BF|nr:helix-turn-helix domain-containing protein [Paenibacillus sp. 79R4]NWL86304.1 DNA-binding response regulator [Paenibacillus sp. 79R4]
MHQLLIVDDEAIAVESLKSGVNWSTLGISQVFTACNAQSAQEVIRHEAIDLLVCDIEMPQGSGLDLLKWVRNYNPAIEAIFLTCHADFQYAKQAIQLGSFDYLLKPVPFSELEAVVGKAIEKLEQESKLNEFSRFGKYWVQHQPLLVERFWLDILNQSIPSHSLAIRKAAEERNIPYSDEMSFLPLLIQIRRWERPVTLRDEKIVEYAIRKSAEELLQEQGGQCILVSVEPGRLLLLLNGDDYSAKSARGLKKRCEAYIDACRRYFYASVSSYIGKAVHGDQIASMYLRLSKMNENNVAYDQDVFLLDEELSPPANQHLLPDMSLWAVLLKEGAYERVLAAAKAYIEAQVQDNQLTSSLLYQFIQDFQQMVYYVLQIKGIQAHRLFGDPESLDLYARSVQSATNSLAWMQHLIGKAADFTSSMEHSPSVVEKVKEYIQQHLSEDLSREDIASQVYLNPDYLTRIFKKETGMSISDYLLQQRLNIAASLLANTGLSVSSIAAQIGYANFSHFSRMFKKYYDKSPLEYRQENSGQQGNSQAGKSSK